jgi:hypothetical protein
LESNILHYDIAWLASLGFRIVTFTPRKTFYGQQGGQQQQCTDQVQGAGSTAATTIYTTAQLTSAQSYSRNITYTLPFYSPLHVSSKIKKNYSPTQNITETVRKIVCKKKGTRGTHPGYPVDAAC